MKLASFNEFQKLKEKELHFLKTVNKNNECKFSNNSKEKISIK